MTPVGREGHSCQTNTLTQTPYWYVGRAALMPTGFNSPLLSCLTGTGKASAHRQSKEDWHTHTRTHSNYIRHGPTILPFFLLGFRAHGRHLGLQAAVFRQLSTPLRRSCRVLRSVCRLCDKLSPLIAAEVDSILYCAVLRRRRQRRLTPPE